MRKLISTSIYIPYLLQKVCPSIAQFVDKFVIPSMHAYAHQTKCLFSYAPKFNKGCGTSSFEQSEVFWSCVGSSVPIIRHVSSPHDAVDVKSPSHSTTNSDASIESQIT